MKDKAKCFQFTIRSLNAIQPADKRLVFHDEEQRGFRLHVEPSGLKVFYYVRKIAGQPKRFKIGEFPTWGIEKARKHAQGLAVSVDKGIDPAEAKRAARAELTLGAAWAIYLTDHAEPRKRASSITGDKSIWRAHLSALKARKLSAITHDDLKRLHRTIGRESPYQANRLLALLSKIYSVAGIASEKNPRRGIRKFPEQERERFLDGDEVGRFLKVLNAAPDPSDPEPVDSTLLDLFAMSLWTGARRGNVQSMAWTEINFKAREWKISGELMKNGRPMTVCLTTPALEILDRRRDANKLMDQAGKGSPWVFPSRRTGQHVTEPRKAWDKVCAKAGLHDVRIHDLRRTLGSWQAMTGASSLVIGKSLGHKNQRSTAIYARLNLDPVRASVNTATVAMLAAAGAEDESLPLAKIG